MNQQAPHADELRVERTTIADHLVLSPSGSLVQGNSEAFGAYVEGILEEHLGGLVLDCKTVEFIDSAGLEQILKLQRALQRMGVAMKAVHLNELCRDIFLATRLASVIHVFPDLGAAVGRPGRS